MKTKLTRTNRKAVAAAGKRPSVKGKKPVNTGAVTRHYVVRTWWVLRGTVLGAVFLGVLYGGYLGVLRFVGLESLSVKNITIEGCRKMSPESILTLSGVNRGEPLLKVDLAEVRARVLRHPAVRDATVVRELPDTLRISVQERSPVAALMGYDYSLVDAEGVVVERVPVYPGGYPLITGSAGSAQPGRKAAETLPALEVLGRLTASGLVGADRISELMTGEDTVRVSLMGSGTVLVFSKKNIQAQVGRLARLVEAGAFDPRSAGYDLRFEGRVIGMAEKKEHAGSGRTASPAGGRSYGQG
ncbi:MAG: FtsQ-type POTRA domain-containing protein [bacterium]|nr:FtsQ-type POTRA domain-containing protein [bacterium]MDT8395278.1 FtsQ-type POTRA domain-containing protein [bacterium]